MGKGGSFKGGKKGKVLRMGREVRGGGKGKG